MGRDDWLDFLFLFYFSFFILDNPVVTLKMGSSLNPDDIKEGDDVYFECHIYSNPKPYKMAWFHDVSMDTSWYTARVVIVFEVEVKKKFAVYRLHWSLLVSKLLFLWLPLKSHSMA